MASSGRPRLLLDTDAMYRLSNPRHPAAELITRAIEHGGRDIIVCQPVLREFLRLVSRKRDPLARLLPILGIVFMGSNTAVLYWRWEPSPADVDAARGTLPDESDIPIWLAAKHCRADVIITYNLRHYTAQAAVPAMTPEGWLAGQHDMASRTGAP
jgi:hypothetical protein